MTVPKFGANVRYKGVIVRKTKSVLMALAALVVSPPTLAQDVVAPAAAPAPSASQSTQALFDAASKALAEERWADALAGYDILEARMEKARSARSLAIVRARRGRALIELGHQQEAMVALENALASLPDADVTLREDRALTMVSIAQVRMAELDYTDALALFSEAEALIDAPSVKAQLLFYRIQAETFTDPEMALRTIDAAETFFNTHAPGNKTIAGQLAQARGRALLNLGRNAEARRELARAVTLFGGLTRKVNWLDLKARGDAAIAALLAGDRVEAQKYIAYTGAGRFDAEFARAGDIETIPCDPKAGIGPDDVAVIEIGIGGDGVIRRVEPVYASKPGPMALAFARAAFGWSWQPESIEKIGTLFLLSTRLEMRCSTAAERPSATSFLFDALYQEFESRKLAEIDVTARSAAEALPLLRAELAKRVQLYGESSPQLLPLLASIATNGAAQERERSATLQRAIAISAAERFSPAARAALELTWTGADGQRVSYALRERNLRKLLERQDFADDPVARSSIAIAAFDSIAGHQRVESGEPLLRSVIDDKRLPERHPLRIAALVRLSAIEAQRNNLTAAQAAFEQTGLDAQQCAVVDAKATVTSTGSIRYPPEALGWSFEGWTINELDVDSEGRPVKPRSVIAYPPFVFSGASAKMLNNFRFTQSFRPAGGLGCGGLRQTFRFSVAN